MKHRIQIVLLLVAGHLAIAAGLKAQGADAGRLVSDEASVSVGRPRPALEAAIMLPHLYHVEARHWPPGCEAAKQEYENSGVISGAAEAACGEKYYEYDGENFITSAGVDNISDVMGKLSSIPANCTYIAATNSALTPAKADTTLTGEITTNGFNNGGSTRWQLAYSQVDAALGTPPTPATPTTVGTTGAGAPSYWVFAGTPQGWTAVGTASTLSTSNTTLTTGNYNVITFTGLIGATQYILIRTHNGTTPSGALAGGSTFASSDGSVGNLPFCSTLVAGAAPTCTVYDQSNTLNAFTVPAADQTYIGKYTLTKTITATGAQSVQGFGIFNATSSGTMCFEGTLSSASLITNDTWAFTETVYH